MVFSLLQLQGKWRDHYQPLSLIKAFDLVSRDGIFKVLPLIGHPPYLLSLIKSFYDRMMSTGQFDGDILEKFARQGFFFLLVKFVSNTSEVGVHLHPRSNGRLFKIYRFPSKTKIRNVSIRDLLYADDDAVACNTKERLQGLLDNISNACYLLSLTISQQIPSDGPRSTFNTCFNHQREDLKVTYQF